MEVRNPNNTVPNELPVYAGCGAEEVVSGTRLIYYIGWHGPLLAPKGTSFAAGTNLATLDEARAEGHELRGGNEPGHLGRGDRIGGVLARGPPRDSGARPSGIRVPRGARPERVGGRACLRIGASESPELLCDGGLGERRQSEPRGLDPELGLLRTVRRVRRPGPGRLLGGGPPAIPRELHLQALGRATGRTRDPRPPHLHLRAALSGPTFIFRFKSK